MRVAARVPASYILTTAEDPDKRVRAGYVLACPVLALLSVSFALVGV